jgi:16S rRNA pseudouridine516 synthase
VRRGRVSVDGQPVRDASSKAEPRRVTVDGEAVECPDGLLALFHKPAGCVCSRDAREGPSVYDLLPARWSQRNPPITTVGRLDKETTGLLVITDVGALVHHWTSPRHKVPKLYEATVDGLVPDDLVARFASGEILLEGESKPCLPARVRITGDRSAEVELVEGRHHQVRRMFAACGLTVVSLHRSRFGAFTLEGIEPGEWRVLDPIPPVRDEPAAVAPAAGA